MVGLDLQGRVQSPKRLCRRLSDSRFAPQPEEGPAHLFRQRGQVPDPVRAGRSFWHIRAQPSGGAPYSVPIAIDDVAVREVSREVFICGSKVGHMDVQVGHLSALRLAHEVRHSPEQSLAVQYIQGETQDPGSLQEFDRYCMNAAPTSQ